MNWQNESPRRAGFSGGAPGGERSKRTWNDSPRKYRPGLDLFRILNAHSDAPKIRECVMSHAFGEPLQDGGRLLFDRPGGGVLTLAPNGAVFDDVTDTWTAIPPVVATMILDLPDARGANFGKVAAFIETALKAAGWPGLKDPANYRQTGGGK